MKAAAYPAPRRFKGRPPVADWLSASEVAGLLGIRPSWFYKLRRKGRMPLTGWDVGAFTYFDGREVRSMIRKRRAA